MRQIFSFLLLILVIKAYAQDTMYYKNLDDKKSTSKSNALYYKVFNKYVKPIEVITYNINGHKISKEHVRSLKSLILNGEYERYFSNGNIDIKGNLKDGMKEGYWLLYNEKDNYIEQKIYFSANLKQDTTFYLNQNGDVVSMEIYSDNVFSYSVKPPKIIDTVGAIDNPEVMPEFPGGKQALMSFLAKNIRYPKLARENNLQGKVVVRFIIDTNGEVANAYILKAGVGGGCENEALRVINLLPKWIPGLQNRQPVKVNYVIPITFNLAR